MTLEGGFLWTRVRLEKQASCIKGSQYWCSASMLSFYMTVCRLLTTWIEDPTYFSYFSFNFWTPSGLYLPSLKIILVIIMIIIYIIMFMVLTSRLRVHLLMQIMLTDWQTNDSVCQYVFICLSPFVCLSLFVSMFVCVLRLVVWVLCGTSVRCQQKPSVGSCLPTPRNSSLSLTVGQRCTLWSES